MSIYDGDGPAAPPPEPCVACGGVGIFEVWNHLLCETCAHDERVANTPLPAEPSIYRCGEVAHESTPLATYRAQTAAWVTMRRAELARAKGLEVVR